MKYVVQYTLPYEHRVMVGIEADSPDEATTKAGALFNEGDIWQDATTVPLLFDDFEENGTDDASLYFTVEQALPDEEPWLAPVSWRRVASQGCRLSGIETFGRGVPERRREWRKRWLGRSGPGLSSRASSNRADCVARHFAADMYFARISFLR